MRDHRFIHFWKKELSDEDLQKWLDKFMLYNRRLWLILLDEKLTRAGV
jgi:hypothetical protein